MRVNQILQKYNLPVTDGYGIICAAEAFARYMHCPVDAVLDGAIFSEEAGLRLIRIMRNLQNPNTEQ